MDVLLLFFLGFAVQGRGAFPVLVAQSNGRQGLPKGGTMADSSERIDALADVTLEVARAAARKDRAFVARLETGMRQSLAARADQPAAFREAWQWLMRFEEGGKDG